jgi:hypothetical protein
MSLTIEEHKSDYDVIHNSDYLYKKPFDVVDYVEYQEPNEYEKNMLKNTFTPEQLLQREQELKDKPKELSEEEKEYVDRRNYIARVKVIANNMLGKNPIDNPSFYNKKDKAKMIEYMDYVINNYTESEIEKEFNEICNDKLFIDGFDYSTLPVYNYTYKDTPVYEA